MTLESYRRPLTLLLLAAGILVNPWTVGYLLASDGSIDQVAHLSAVLLVELLFLTSALGLMTGWVNLGDIKRRPLHPAVLAIVGVSCSIAGAYWGIGLYDRGHSHTIIVPSELENITLEQRQWTVDFYDRSLKAALDNGWFDFDTAMQQGFQKDPINRTHYPHPQYMFDDIILDPERPEWLVYHDSPDGKVLMALMFFTRELEEVGPTPAGPLALWHFHPYNRTRCAINGLWTVGEPGPDGVCAKGEPVLKTPEMFHVWFIDHPLGRFTEMKIVPEYWQDTGFRIGWVHPVLVHFTIALFTIAVLMDLLGVFLKNEKYHFAAWLNLLLAAVFTVGTVAFGMTAEVYAKPTIEAHWTLDTHKLFAYGVCVVLAILVAWRAGLRGVFPKKGAMLFIILGLLGVTLTAGAGYYGGEMVYTHGTNVRAIPDFLRERYWAQVRTDYLPRNNTNNE